MRRVMEPMMGNTNERSSSKKNVSTRLNRIAELARQMPGAVLTTLSHHIDEEFLRETYRQIRKDGAAGVDEVTAAQYEENLDQNLTDLLGRFKRGSYIAPPVRRVYIPKADGTQRALGIPTLEDKILQKAVAMVLGAVYEQDFLPVSYGYRPGTGALKAVSELREELMEMKGGWVLEVDIKSYFDTVKHPHLRSFLDKRVRDGVIRRAIDKWLKAGVKEEGRMWFPLEGTPQGGVISPLLANLYLHEVLDVWFEQQVRPSMRGRVRLFRYADDFVICFEREQDARRVAEVMPKRFAKFGLKLHPDKTRLMRFCPPRAESDDGEPPTFDFLGFTHYWARSRRGYWVVKKQTANRRLARKIHEYWQWCRANRHEPVEWQWEQLRSRLNGYYQYFGVIGNFKALHTMYRETKKSWRYWLNRRSQRGRMGWRRFRELEKRFPLPKPRIVHKWV